MTDEVLVKVENISKKFCRSLKKSLWYGLQDIGSEVTGRKYEHELRSGEFWSVSNLSFELRRGECLGLIGPNGAGKSTLLKMINGSIKPDKGRIEVTGRLGSLIELGTGFNPILTGRENIYSNGTILGLTKNEIDAKMEQIIEFSELTEFIDSPVQNYSSGMKVRLGFAVAAHMEPDVLIIDEVLAVGDVGFRAKCYNAIYSMIRNAAVIIVTHSMPQISRVCSDIMVMRKGSCEFLGKDLGRGIDLFYSYFQGEEGIVLDNGKAAIHKITLKSNGREDVKVIKYLDELIIEMVVSIDQEITNPVVGISLLNQELTEIAQCVSFYNKYEIVNLGKKMTVSLDLGRINFNPGLYSLVVSIASGNFQETLIKQHNVKQFKVEGDFYGYASIQIDAKWSVVEQEINTIDIPI